jgi:hypothetical protein
MRSISPSDPASDPVVQKLAALEVEETMAVYLGLVESDPEKADVAALALREHGRGGRLTHEHVETLANCVLVAPNSLCAGHLAKALAALGREAGAAAGSLVAKMRGLVISTDVEYWSFDGAVWALGYLGGDEASLFLDELEAETPSRAVRSNSIYRGAMPKDARQQCYEKALLGARGLLANPLPGVWRERKTNLPLSKSGSQQKVAGKAWDLRSALNDTPKSSARPTLKRANAR